MRMSADVDRFLITFLMIVAINVVTVAIAVQASGSPAHALCAVESVAAPCPPDWQDLRRARVATNDAIVRAELAETLNRLLETRAKSMQRKIDCLGPKPKSECQPETSNYLKELETARLHMRESLALSDAANFVPEGVRVNKGLDEKFISRPTISHVLPGASRPEPLTKDEFESAKAKFSLQFKNDFQSFDRWRRAQSKSKGKDSKTLESEIQNEFASRYDDIANRHRDEARREYARTVASYPELIPLDTQRLNPVAALAESLKSLRKFQSEIKDRLDHQPEMVLLFEPLLAKIALDHPECAAAIKRLDDTAATLRLAKGISIGAAGAALGVGCVFVPEAILFCTASGLTLSGVAYVESDEAYHRSLGAVLSGLAREDYSKTTIDEAIQHHSDSIRALAQAGVTLLPLGFNFGKIGAAERTTEIAVPAAAEALPDGALSSKAIKKIENVAKAVRREPFSTTVEDSNFARAAISRVKDSQMQKTLEATYEHMRDREAWTQYFETLTHDAARLMMNSKNPNEVRLVQNGQISRTALLKVLVQRAKDRGEVFTTIRANAGPKGDGTLTLTELGGNISKGPFFDKGFAGYDHGIDTHILQRDFIAPYLEARAPGTTDAVFKFLGSKEGLPVWEQIFDGTPSAKNPTSPEYLGWFIQKHLPLK